VSLLRENTVKTYKRTGVFMDNMFNRFNRKSLQDRRIDTLIGLGKGILADGSVEQAEAEFLLNWLAQNQDNSDNPIICNLLIKVTGMLEDGVLDVDEAKELKHVLQSICGEASELGELSKTTSLPVDKPSPKIKFKNSNFVFTGTFAFGTRKECQAVIDNLGGKNISKITKQLNYLILGTYVTDSWAHESFGRKIEKAIEYRDSGIPIIICTEEHWANEAGL
jgi:NAD-dependent DNA ligase